MKELMAYAAELARTTRFRELDIANALFDLRDLKIPEDKIEQLIESTDRSTLSLKTMVDVVFGKELETRRKQKLQELKQLCLK